MTKLIYSNADGIVYSYTQDVNTGHITIGRALFIDVDLRDVVSYVGYFQCFRFVSRSLLDQAA